MTTLTMNLVKRVDRLPKPRSTTDAMQPLFEAISNAIHSTQEKYKDRVSDYGRIDIDITTGRRQVPVKIIVQDNGVGLNTKNFDAFVTTDTDNKIAIGGKGVGRLLWLDCFEHIHIESFYEENDIVRTRSFDFCLAADNQIQNLKDKASQQRPISSGMVATFEGLRDNGYRAKFPGRPTYIFQHLTSHFLPTFIGRKSPRIVVQCGDETREYPDAIDEVIYRREDVEQIPTEEYGALSLTLMECDKVASADLPGSHFIHFIAHDRTVHSQKIDGKLGLKYFGDELNRVFHACLFGEYLDTHVNQERTRFVFDDSVIEAIVNDVCMPHIEKFLSDPMSQLRKEQGAIVEKIVDSYPSVAFGTVETLQDHVPTGELNDDAIYGHLSRERFRRDQRQAEKVRAILERLRGDQIDESSFGSAIAEASEAIEDAEQKSLAEYIVRRKAVLDFLEILVQKVRIDAQDSSYQREDVLHTFICPMRINTLSEGGSQVVPAASHDLWVIDERLTFARYFSSDVSFSEIAKRYASDERPDLLIFDRVHGLRQTDDASKILLVEFKRPGRTTYGDDENPQLQVERYIKRLLDGGQTDVRGRPIELKQNTVFYCFIVADCLGRMDEWTYSWRRTADGRGRIYQPGNGFNGTIELIGWDSVIGDARERNKAFFDKAGLGGQSFFNHD